MTTAILHDHNLEKHIEKQMGCMTVFFQLFERNQIINNKRINSTKRLPPPTVLVSTSDLVKTVTSPGVTEEMDKPQLTKTGSPRSDRFKSSPVKEVRSMSDSVTPTSVPAKLPVPFPIFEFKPRLSLDSRATIDSKGSLQPRDIRTKLAILSQNPSDSSENGSVTDTDDSHRRSPSVIARLMGLEPLTSCPEATKKAELRRSASESRVTRDLLQCQSVDVNNLAKKRNNYQSPLSQKQQNTTSLDNVANSNSQTLMKNSASGICGGSQWKSHLQRKSFYDSDDYFPEPKQTSYVYAEIGKRLKMKGIDDPSKDLDTLKQLLEALQLKGLLHSKTAVTQTPDIIRHRNNFVYDRSFPPDESHITTMQSRIIRRLGNEFPPPSAVRRISSADLSPQRQQPEIDRAANSQPRIRSSSGSYARRESNAKAPNPIAGKRQSAIGTAKKSNNEQRRVSPSHSQIQSPRSKSATDLSPKNRQQTTAEVNNTVTSSPQTDSDRRPKTVESSRGGGRSLLERCDKLLNSIAEMTVAESQPSPVSVLEYKDESASPSPVLKRCIDFKVDAEQQEVEYEDDYYYSQAISPIVSNKSSDFDYITDIFRALTYLPEGSDVFLLVEKQQYLKGKDGSKFSRLERMAIFDTVCEILERNRQLPPWKAAAAASSCSWLSLDQIWREFQNIRWHPDEKKPTDEDKEEDPVEMIVGIMRKDLDRDEMNGWGKEKMEEISEGVLDIERLIFKDLIGETIRDVANVEVVRSVGSLTTLRRRIVF